MQSDPLLRFSTYSIVARDPDSGQFGVGVQTHQMCVGVAVPWVAPGIGVIATQALTNVHFGPLGLRLLRQGVPAEQTLEALIATDAAAHNRQLAVVDREGRSAAWTGENCIQYADHHLGEGYSVQANMMVNPGVVKAMAEAYEKGEGEFFQRLLLALRAAQDQGGDIRGMQSAALKIVQAGEMSEEKLPYVMPLFDLRVDEAADPLGELDRLALMRHAQLVDREGHTQSQKGNLDEALELWGRARHLAPELEELAFWQAASLADDYQDYSAAAKLLETIVEDRAHWVDLLRRLQACGILEQPGTAEALISAWVG